MTLTYVVLGWTLLAIPAAIVVGRRLRTNRVARDGDSIWEHLSRRRWQSTDDIYHALNINVEDIEDALRHLWRHNRVDHRDGRVGRHHIDEWAARDTYAAEIHDAGQMTP